MNAASRAIGLSLVLLGSILLGVLYVATPVGGSSFTQCGISAQNPCTATVTKTQNFTATQTATGTTTITITTGSTTTQTTTQTTTILSKSTSVVTTTVIVIYSLNGTVSTITRTVTQTQTQTSGVNNGIAKVTVVVNWDGKPSQGATVSLAPSWGSCTGSSLAWISCPSIAPPMASGTTGADGTYSTAVTAASAGSFEGFYGSGSCCQPTGAIAGYFVTVTANGVTTQQGSVAVVYGDGTLNPNPSLTAEADPSYVPPCTATPKLCSQLSAVMVGGFPINGTYLLYAGVGSLVLGGVVLVIGSRKGGPPA